MIQTLAIRAALTRPALQDLIARIRQIRLGVLGDFTLDGYWYADMTRAQLSRETPLFPRPVVRETYSNGGAANVAWNLADLGLGEVRAFTVLGTDWRTELLLQALDRAGVRTDSVVTTPDWLTPFYGKVILTNGEIQQEDGRVDFVNTRPLPEEAEEELLAAIEHKIASLDGLVLADYQTLGVVTGRAAAAAGALAERYPDKVFMVDSRDRLDHFHGKEIKIVLKPNDLEASRLFFPEPGVGAVPLEALAEAGMERQQGTGLPLFITLGGCGCLVLARGEARLVPAVPLQTPLDPVGAGDTFLSAAAAALAAGASPLEAAALANLAAGVTVRKLHVTGTACPGEILAVYDDLPEGSDGTR